MKYALLVNGAPLESQAARSALYFSQALLERGHHLLRVFFYGAGVQLGNGLQISAQDESNLLGEWQALALAGNTELVLCIAAAQRRGILSAAEALRHGRPPVEVLATGFTLAGLGTLVDAALDVDRLVTFQD